MSEPDQPKTPRKGQFQKGNKFSKGRRKGTENKFGPGFREKLLAGIIASGEKKARKNGVNGKVDGFSYFIESLVDGNGGAAATLIAKMLPSEPPPPAPTGPGVTINIHSAAEGQQYLPGNEVFMPFDEAREVWLAYNAGAEAWAACLQTLEAKLTLKAYESLCHVPLHERKMLAPPDEPLLHLVPKPPEMLEARLEAVLNTMPHEELRVLEKLMVRAGLAPERMGPNDDDNAA